MKTFIITRDRVSYAKRCLASLARFPELEPIIVDHRSTYPPMREWLIEQIKHKPVVLRGDHGPRDLWMILPTLVDPDERFIVTDCDIALPEAPYPDAIWKLGKVLDGAPRIIKAGLALRIDDLPDNELTRRVIRWESQFWRMPSGEYYEAPIDTTFAMYRSLSEVATFELGPAYRLAGPYSARHLPWYEIEEDEELRYYREHALLGTTNWSSPETYP